LYFFLQMKSKFYATLLIITIKRLNDATSLALTVIFIIIPPIQLPPYKNYLAGNIFKACGYFNHNFLANL
ncbi:MAG: hypothetical protein M1609_13740, partial [Firmicutes bacterium]|nr:hypothetical protein [Bacillota bacterium]